jgi:hypothetical protein
VQLLLSHRKDENPTSSESAAVAPDLAPDLVEAAMVVVGGLFCLAFYLFVRIIAATEDVEWTPERGWWLKQRGGWRVAYYGETPRRAGASYWYAVVVALCRLVIDDLGFAFAQLFSRPCCECMCMSLLLLVFKVCVGLCLRGVLWFSRG